MNSPKNTILTDTTIIDSWINKLKKWFGQKSNIHKSQERPPYFKSGDIWWCQLGENIGDEQNGKGDNFLRPMIVIKKFNKNICLAVPTSTRLKENKYYYQIEYKQKKYSALVSQLRTVDTKRFKKKITQITNKDLEKLKQYLKEILF